MKGLAGQRLLITRARDDLAPLAELVRARGAQPICFPCIELLPPDGPELAALDAALAALAREAPAAIPLASPHAVEFLLLRMRALGLAPSLLGRSLVAAAGEATARALEAHGVAAQRPASGAGAAPLAVLLREWLSAPADAGSVDAPPGDGWHATHLRPGARVLLPQAAEATPLLAGELRAAGFSVEPLVLYRTVAATLGAAHDEGLAALRARRIDAITFASGSAARGFQTLLGDEAHGLAAHARIACMGASCAEVARSLGFAVAAVGSSGLGSLLDALEASG